jgi:uncharacterized protein (TIGR03382 family)
MSQIRIGDVYCPPGATYDECAQAIEALGHDADPKAKPSAATVAKSADVAGEVERQRLLARILRGELGAGGGVPALLGLGGVALFAWLLARRGRR